MHKPSWAVAFLLSILYAFLFARVNHGRMRNNLLFGFCVWGSPETPDKQHGCSRSPLNSHNAAFYLDLIQVCLVVPLYAMDRTPKEKKAHAEYVLQTGFMLAHGLLHWLLQQTVLPLQINCYEPDLHAHVYAFGASIFFVFSFFLAYFVLALGFGTLLALTVKRTLASIVFASLVVALTYHSEWELFLPTLFVMSHPLACVVGLFSQRPRFNKFVATLFALCTLVGVLELWACSAVLQPIGGHLWYDLTLHSACHAALPYFWSPETRAASVSPHANGDAQPNVAQLETTISLGMNIQSAESKTADCSSS